MIRLPVRLKEDLTIVMGVVSVLDELPHSYSPMLRLGRIIREHIVGDILDPANTITCEVSDFPIERVGWKLNLAHCVAAGLLSEERRAQMLNGFRFRWHRMETCIVVTWREWLVLQMHREYTPIYWMKTQ